MIGYIKKKKIRKGRLIADKLFFIAEKTITHHRTEARIPKKKKIIDFVDLFIIIKKAFLKIFYLIITIGS